MAPLKTQDSSNASSYRGKTSSKRACKPAPSRSHSLVIKPYPQGPPITTAEKLFFILNEAEITATPLVAADDLLAPLFNDKRNGLEVRKIGSSQISLQESKLLKESFRTTFTRTMDPDYPKWWAENFTMRMRSHGIVAMGGDEADAFSNLALRYSCLRHSSLVRVDGATMNGRVEARIVAKAHIPKGSLILELGGIMSADSIEPQPLDTARRQRSRRNRNVPPTPAFKMFSVIWKANDQCGPGPRKDRLLLGPARFINHSCKPNCKLIPFPKTHAWGVGTLQDIEEGEEITVSYGDHYFDPGECACAPCVASPSRIMEKPCPEVTSRKKRRWQESEAEFDASRPTKRVR